MNTDPRITVISDNGPYRELVFALVDTPGTVFRLGLSGSVIELSVWTHHGFEKVCFIPGNGEIVNSSRWNAALAEGVDTAIRFASVLAVQS